MIEEEGHPVPVQEPERLKAEVRRFLGNLEAER